MRNNQVSLQPFMQAYQQWVLSGAPSDHPTFRRDMGLCRMLNRWCSRVYTDKQSYHLHVELQCLIKLWVDEVPPDARGEHPMVYPFNGGSWDTYIAESKSHQCHTNAMRLGFVQINAAHDLTRPMPTAWSRLLKGVKQWLGM